MFPETSFYTTITAVFLISYFAAWVLWTTVQFQDPGAYVGPKKSNKLFSGGNKSSHNADMRITVEEESCHPHEKCCSEVNPKKTDAHIYRDMYIHVIDNGLLVPVCPTCEIVKPLRSKHDRFTDQCISRFDHYCPFMGVAVGEGNYFYFFFSMLSAGITIWVWLALVAIYTYRYNPYASFLANFWQLIGFEVSFLIALYVDLLII